MAFDATADAYRLLIVSGKKNLLIRLTLLVATLAWMGFIFFLSSLESLAVGENYWHSDWQSNLGHMALYGILSTLIMSTLLSWKYRLTLLTATIAIAIAAIYALSDEYHQSFVVGRHATFTDVWFDIAGSLIIVLPILPVKSVKKLISTSMLFRFQL